MKGLLKKFVALAAMGLFWSSQASAVLIEIVPGTIGPADPGDIIYVDIVASDLGDDVITAYDILVTFDDAYLDLFFADIGTGLGFWDGWSDAACDTYVLCPGPDYDYPYTATDAIGVGEVSYLWDDEFISLGYQDGNPFTLFTLGFEVIADLEGSTALAFVWDEFRDVKCANNEVCFPTAVPEPGTLALLGIGLLGMAATRRRRRT